MKIKEIIEYVKLHGRSWAYGEDGGDCESGPDYSGIEYGIRLGPLFIDPEGESLFIKTTGKVFDSTGKDITHLPPY